MKLKYRMLVPNDIDAVYDIEVKCFSVPWSYDGLYKDIIDNPCAIYIGAFDGEYLVGYAGMWVILDEAHITNIAVLPECRGKGIGRRMLNGMLRIARRADEMIYANSPEAKGKVEKGNDTIQQRLLNDIKRFNITSVEELNEWFNSFYCKYLNKKFSYFPKESKSEFMPLTKEFKKSKLHDLFVIKTDRTILNGNCISINNNYYVPLDKEKKPVPFYKGTMVEVQENIFDHSIKIFKNNKVYNTKQIEGHIKSEELRLLKINNQKELNAAIDTVYSSSEERRKTIQAIIDKNALEEKLLSKKIANNKTIVIGDKIKNDSGDIFINE